MSHIDREPSSTLSVGTSKLQSGVTSKSVSNGLPGPQNLQVETPLNKKDRAVSMANSAQELDGQLSHAHHSITTSRNSQLEGSTKSYDRTASTQYKIHIDPHSSTNQSRNTSNQSIDVDGAKKNSIRAAAPQEISKNSHGMVTSPASMVPPPPQVPAAAATGTVPAEKHKYVGNYEMLKTVGEGSFARVKLAVHRLTNQKVITYSVNKPSFL
jgi:hypothetical protein